MDPRLEHERLITRRHLLRPSGRRAGVDGSGGALAIAKSSAADGKLVRAVSRPGPGLRAFRTLRRGPSG